MYCAFRWVRNVFPPAKAISRGGLFVRTVHIT
nr:MAG TPA: Spore coat associated protein JA (CotJA) [Caudoviricetes sp.]